MINEGPVPICLFECAAQLGEGPLWDTRDATLWWVDIRKPEIFRMRADGTLDRWTPPFQVASLGMHAAGGFIAGTGHGFAMVDPEHDSYTLLHNPEVELPGNRFNDGKVDRHGRFWAGTMDDRERTTCGALYRLHPDQQAVRVDDGYHVTNGPAFSPAGDRLYVTDSAARTIYTFALSPDGEATDKKVFARFGEQDGYPDGMTVDVQGCLWIAFWDGWCIRRLAPDGTRLAEIRLPIQRPTSCAFGGANLDRLFVTSARTGLDPQALESQPQAGGLFALDLGIAGLAERPFG